MASPHPLPIALEAARLRHADNVAIQAIVRQLERAMATARSLADQAQVSPLAGYHRGAQGDEGYCLMFNIETSIFTSQMREITQIHAIAVLTEVLAAALNDLGEEIPL